MGTDGFNRYSVGSMKCFAHSPALKKKLKNLYVPNGLFKDRAISRKPGVMVGGSSQKNKFLGEMFNVDNVNHFLKVGKSKKKKSNRLKTFMKQDKSNKKKTRRKHLGKKHKHTLKRYIKPIKLKIKLKK